MTDTPQVEELRSAADRAFDAHRWLSILGNWRAVFAHWQLGRRQEGDPEQQAVRDHREATLQLRAEVNALTNLLIRKGAFTQSEYTDALGIEARAMCERLERQFPGFVANDGGVSVDERAGETMRGWQQSHHSR